MSLTVTGNYPSVQSFSAMSATPPPQEQPPCYQASVASSPCGPAKRYAFSRNIDCRKLNTKPCHYVARGLPCPFEGRCAFSHEVRGLTANKLSFTSLHNPITPEPLSPTTDSLLSPNSQQSSGVYRPQPYLPLFVQTSCGVATQEAAHGTDSSASREEEDGASRSGNSLTGTSLPTYSNSRRTAATPAATETAAPPSYEETLMIQSSYQSSPPGYRYRLRYRHDPYSFDGVLYVA